MSPQSHNNPGSDWRRGGAANFTPPGHRGARERETREEETTSTSHVEICVDIPLLNLIVNEWFIAGPGERTRGDPPYHHSPCRLEMEIEGNYKSSPFASLNLQYFAIYD